MSGRILRCQHTGNGHCDRPKFYHTQFSFHLHRKKFGFHFIYRDGLNTLIFLLQNTFANGPRDLCLQSMIEIKEHSWAALRRGRCQDVDLRLNLAKLTSPVQGTNGNHQYPGPRASPKKKIISAIGEVSNNGAILVRSSRIWIQLRSIGPGSQVYPLAFPSQRTTKTRKPLIIWSSF